MKQIQLIVAPDGKTRLETQGFAGSECLGASRFLETALGRQTAEQKTAAYHQTTHSDLRQTHKET